MARRGRLYAFWQHVAREVSLVAEDCLLMLLGNRLMRGHAPLKGGIETSEDASGTRY
jgi:hypothetical protein